MKTSSGFVLICLVAGGFAQADCSLNGAKYKSGAMVGQRICIGNEWLSAAPPAAGGDPKPSGQLVPMALQLSPSQQHIQPQHTLTPTQVEPVPRLKQPEKNHASPRKNSLTQFGTAK